MSENTGDWGETELDPAEEAAADVNLEDPTAGDDEPWTPPDRQPRGAELIGVETEGDGESLDQRVLQEVPDQEPDPEPESVGGDDPDAIPADRDVLGGPPAADLGVAGTGPEESAMRVEQQRDER